MFDSLEKRLLLTQLTVAGTQFGDGIELSVAGQTASGVDVRVKNTGGHAFTVKVDEITIELAPGKTVRSEQIKVGGVTIIRPVDLGSGNDRLTTDPAINLRMTVSGGNGDDVLSTGSNDDVIDGGPGNDFIEAGSGRDTVTGGAGSDNISGGSGNDVLKGNGSVPRTTLNETDDIDGGVGDDQLTGADGPTLAVPAGESPTHDRLLGGDGSDTLRAGNVATDLRGGNGPDSLVGGPANDELDGDAGNDTVAGGKGNDQYEFYAAAPSAEQDSLAENANEGTDRILFDEDRFHDDNFVRDDRTLSSIGVSVDLASATQFIRQGARSVTTPPGLQNNFENVVGGIGPDTISGSGANNALSGMISFVNHFAFGPTFLDDDQPDRIDGRGGADTLEGNGPDPLIGGEGNDVFNTYHPFGTIAVPVSGGNGTDQQNVLRADLTELTMGPGLENLTLLAGTIGHVIGNELNNHIIAQPNYPGFQNLQGPGNYSTISGGNGNDTIESGIGNGDYGLIGGPDEVDYTGNFPRTFEGNAGNDLLIGVADPEVVRDNLYLRGGSGRDTLQASSGTVWADFSDLAAPVRVDMSTGTSTSAGVSDTDVFGTGVTRVRGTAGNDTLLGDGRDNVLDGAGGADDLSGRGGKDTAWYGDRAHGVTASLNGLADDGETNEHDLIRSDVEGLTGTRFNDTLNGGSGNDLLIGLGGDDSLNGGGGDDSLIGDGFIDFEGGVFDRQTFEGNDLLIGGPGSDTAIYRSALERFYLTVTLDGIANDGTPDFPGGTFDNVMTDNVDGAYIVYGDDGPNTLTNVQASAFGNGGNDTLVGDILFNSPTLIGGPGADRMEHGVIDYSDRTHDISVSLNNVADDGEAGEGDNVIGETDANFPNIIVGGQGNDRLTGGNVTDELYGLAGDDTINGMGGDDRLYGGSAAGLFQTLTDSGSGSDGNDSITGGSGNDVADYGIRTDDLTITLDGVANDGAAGEHDNINTDVERVLGGSGDDSFTAGPNGTTFVGGPGADTFVGGNGSDAVSYAGSAGGVTVTLDGVANDGAAGEGDNVTASIDRVEGGSGADRITAGSRSATLSGGGGADTLTGGSGDDTFVMSPGSTALGKDGDDLFINQNLVRDTINGGDGFDVVQDDDTSTAPGLQNDTFTDVEFVYDTLDDGGAVVNVAPAKLAATFAAATPIAATAAVVSGVDVHIEGTGRKARLIILGTSDSDTILLTQSGSTVTVNTKRKADAAFTTKTFSTSAFVSIAITAAGGNDTVNLGSGSSAVAADTRVAGGSGNDAITGGRGNDQLAGEAGSDNVNGGEGNDVVSGDYVVLVGESVPPLARGQDVSDTVNGGGGSTDIVSYTYRNAAMNMDLDKKKVTSIGGESDQVSGCEYVISGRKDDVIAGSSVNEFLFGGPGGDSLNGGPGADRLDGGFGTDTLNPNGGSDFLDTGGTDDTDDGADDNIIGSLDRRGFNPLNSAGATISGQFDSRDFFTLSGRYFGQKVK